MSDLDKKLDRAKSAKMSAAPAPQSTPGSRAAAVSAPNGMAPRSHAIQDALARRRQATEAMTPPAVQAATRRARGL